MWSNPELSGLLKIFLDRNKNFVNRIPRNNSISEEIKEIFMIIDREAHSSSDNCNLMIKNLLINMLILLNRDYGYVSEEYMPSYNETVVQLEKAINYINENIENEITLEKLARVAAMNRTYFSTVFKKFNGISPWDYITIKRVEKSIELMKTTELTKLDIALRCGFNSHTNFYKAFRRVTGKNPGDFQKAGKDIR